MPSVNSLYYKFPWWVPQVGDIAVRTFLDPHSVRVCVITKVGLNPALHRGGLLETVEWSPINNCTQERVIFPDEVEYVGGLDSLGVKLIERNNDNDEAE